MKAWTYTRGGYPRALSLTTVPAPSSTALSPTTVLIQVRAFGLNPVDIQLMNLPLWYLPFLGGPKQVGCDFSGTVLATGSRITDFAPGDAVFGMSFAPQWNGSAKEVLALDVSSGTSVLAKKPAGWSFGRAAALPLVFLTARSCVRCVEPYMADPGDYRVARPGVLVVLGGSSSCGMYCVQLAKQRGWRVLSTCSARNVEFVKSLGADEVVDYTASSVPEAVRKARPDAIIDCVGGTECLGLAKRYVTIVGDKTDRSAMGGSFIYWWNPQMVLRWLVGWVGLAGSRYDCIVLEKSAEYLAEAAVLKEDQVVVDSVFQFEELKSALDRLGTGKVRGKVVVEIKE